MAITLNFFRDSGLSVPGLSLACNQADDGSSAAVDRVFYLGSPVVGRQFEDAAAPGTDAITVSVEDSGSGVLPSAVKLALSAAGLDTAVAGAPLAVGTQILSGPGNGIAVHVRVDTPAQTAGTYTNLRLQTSSCVEVTA